jgi:hypothetical protein
VVSKSTGPSVPAMTRASSAVRWSVRVLRHQPLRYEAQGWSDEIGGRQTSGEVVWSGVQVDKRALNVIGEAVLCLLLTLMEYDAIKDQHFVG